MLIQLPKDIIIEFSIFLSIKDIQHILISCKSIHKIICSFDFFKFYFKEYIHLLEINSTLKTIQQSIFYEKRRKEIDNCKWANIYIKFHKNESFITQTCRWLRIKWKKGILRYIINCCIENISLENFYDCVNDVENCCWCEKKHYKYYLITSNSLSFEHNRTIEMTEMGYIQKRYYDEKLYDMCYIKYLYNQK